ncbi:hypothetical protein PUMCH_003552 [Australozyma saopauloensis]|uniref:F-box domain-containing protein n=1 Tax=Australozyma saopauloensis TaxID=291208 RepID=A0AAX4HC92_9ASCO|nr:hypothetical protein PUMCH_003552 [[Candida] saopauloensis]
MGFIVAGHGYKRRKFRADKAGLVVLPDGFLRVSLFRPSPNRILIPTPPPENVDLIDLPPEILWRIFAYTGLGSSNLLHLTCSYFSRLFTTSNPWLLTLVARNNSLFNLNAEFGVSTGNWREKFLVEFNSLPRDVGDQKQIQQLFETAFKILDCADAIDSAIFTLPNIGVPQIEELRLLNHSLVCDRRAINEQRKSREKYLEWQYQILQAFSKKVKDGAGAEDTGPSVELLLSESENTEQIMKFRDLHGLAAFEPLIKSQKISATLSGPVNVSQVRKILALSKLFDLEFQNPTRFVARVLTSKIALSEELAEVLLDIINVNSVSSKELLGVLSAYKSCQDFLFEVPLESRASHYLQPLLEKLYTIMELCLSSYYENGEGRLLDGQVWELLYQIQIPELIEHVVAMGGTPTCDVL